MKVVKYGRKTCENSILCLGYFDAIHKGHRSIIEIAKSTAKSENLKVALMLFTGGKNGEKDLFTLDERLFLLEREGVDIVIVQQLDATFMSKSKVEFLDDIFAFTNAKAIVTGKDFKFGKKAQGDVEFLKEYCKIKKVKVLTAQDVLDENGAKISTQSIKNLIKNGEVEIANKYLDGKYFILGKIVKGKGLGEKIGFPTANVLASDNKAVIKWGVYLTSTEIGGKEYKCITNVGSQPTFDGESEVIESYIDGFSGNLYGKTLKFYFEKRIRDIVKFQSIKELILQLEKDKEYLK